ncbi:uncharacterized protein LOC112271606 [Brachypodium distachyon]|uniref:uncharacterized protein LOC112271606 n=1 Tax=Brachypodium distachyon TaxID=15368 RepID=UPI000D0CE928|nr:uncharacterized protein LOC112271606 [Brachypodium distachyon]XP_024317002.1 uncharacterized protein LOC112271606 [Brachypodium distachyon]|eukprot:XP_024317001.1 uncharacterized protein LOC112271606 [Brachypodium distachyon]
MRVLSFSRIRTSRTFAWNAVMTVSRETLGIMRWVLPKRTMNLRRDSLGFWRMPWRSLTAPGRLYPPRKAPRNCAEVTPRLEGVVREVHELGTRLSLEGQGELVGHDLPIGSGGEASHRVHLQEIQRVGLTIILGAHVRAENGRPDDLALFRDECEAFRSMDGSPELDGVCRLVLPFATVLHAALDADTSVLTEAAIEVRTEIFSGGRCTRAEGDVIILPSNTGRPAAPVVGVRARGNGPSPSISLHAGSPSRVHCSCGARQGLAHALCRRESEQSGEPRIPFTLLRRVLGRREMKHRVHCRQGLRGSVELGRCRGWSTSCRTGPAAVRLSVPASGKRATATRGRVGRLHVPWSWWT